MSKLKTTTVCVEGMHCPSCDILVKDKFQEVSNIKEVQANHQTQQAEITYTGTLNKAELDSKIQQFGYRVVDKISTPLPPLSYRITEASMIGLILFIAYFFAQELQLLPSFSNSSALSLTTIFLVGLVASTSTCMATSGALFLATIGKLNNKQGSIRQNLVPAISFNMGRILSYGFFGFLVGAIGKSLTSNVQLGSFLTLFVSVLMIFLGLDMLKIFSLSSLLPVSLTKGLFEKLEHRLIQTPQKTSFFLGAITYLLPCGFTQAVQLYALSTANPIASAFIMMLFALGTTPALLAIGYTSTFTRTSWYPLFAKGMAVLIILVGVSYVGNALTLYGINVDVFARTNNVAPTNDSTVPLENGYQVVRMNVNAQGYEPNSFTVKQGVPVKWIVNGENTLGCQSSLVAPKANIQTVIKTGENVFEFTPKEKGPLTFSCSMGMYSGQFNVI